MWTRLGRRWAALLPRCRPAHAQAPRRETRIGYQKTAIIVIARQQAILEKHFGAKQIAIKWIEFTSGPRLLEAMSTTSVDLGAVGDSPPIFAPGCECEHPLMPSSRDRPSLWTDI